MKPVLTFLLALIYCTIYSQNIYKVSSINQANVKVFIVQYVVDADLKVFKCQSEGQANGNEGKWYFVNYVTKADKTVFFVEFVTQADIKIYFVNSIIQAGWVNESKRYLLDSK